MRHLLSKFIGKCESLLLDTPNKRRDISQTTTSFAGQCGSVVERNAQVKRHHLEWTKFNSVEEYATLRSSTKSESCVWCFLFLVWLTILIIAFIYRFYCRAGTGICFLFFLFG